MHSILDRHSASGYISLFGPVQQGQDGHIITQSVSRGTAVCHTVEKGSDLFYVRFFGVDVASLYLTLPDGLFLPLAGGRSVYPQTLGCIVPFKGTFRASHAQVSHSTAAEHVHDQLPHRPPFMTHLKHVNVINRGWQIRNLCASRIDIQHLAEQ